MSRCRLILLMSVSVDGFARRPGRTIDWPAPAPADEQLTALRLFDDRQPDGNKTEER
jgi:hypothetical protein